MTDLRPRTTPPRMNLSAREWKLFLIGGLGVAYAASLGMVATQAQPAASQPSGAAPTTSIDRTSAVVWLGQLPVSQRPAVAPPAGWTIATSAGQTAAGQSPVAAVTTSSSTPGSTAGGPRILTRTS
jgi:hypothetical protein